MNATRGCGLWVDAPDVTLYGADDNDCFGCVDSSLIADVTGDGIGDLVIGAPGAGGLCRGGGAGGVDVDAVRGDRRYAEAAEIGEMLDAQLAQSAEILLAQAGHELEEVPVAEYVALAAALQAAPGTRGV